MDSADSDPVQRALLTQEALLERHEKMLHHINKELSALTQALAQRTPLVSSPSPSVNPSPRVSPSPSPNPQAAAAPPDPPAAWLEAPGRTMPSPEPFTGELEKCSGFLAQVSLFFRQQNRTYASDGARIAFFVQLLRDRALQWAQALLKTLPNISYLDFLTEFKSVFERDGGPSAAAQRLLNLKQGKRTMADFSVDFRILAVETGWKEEAVKEVLLNNIAEDLKDELMTRELPSSLSSLMSLCIHVDERLRMRRGTRHSVSQSAPLSVGIFAGSAASPQQPASVDVSPGEAEPMQIGRARLTPTERQRRFMAGECLYCGRHGHFIAVCPARAKGRARQ